jgi:hypothetical protein
VWCREGSGALARAAEVSVSPTWFAQIISEGKVRINGDSQAIIEQEIRILSHTTYNALFTENILAMDHLSKDGSTMGMFDTIYLKKPLICPDCGAEEFSLQTKHFDCCMADFKIGSVLSGSPVLIGIIKETIWCNACHKAGRQSARSPVYLVIWHSLLAAVEQDLAKAEARLAAVDRLDLIAWLDEAQRDSEQWSRKYHKLFSDVSRWHERINRPPEPELTGPEAERHRAFRRFLSLPEEILTAPDPLAAILMANKQAGEDAED